MRPRLLTLLIAAIALATLLLFFTNSPRLHKQQFKAYFKNGMQLRDGAAVVIAGVPVGRVKRVQVHPENRQTPVEVILEVATTYELPIPEDAFATLGTAGLLGESFIEINLSAAMGPPARDNTVLKTVETQSTDATAGLAKVLELLTQRCDQSETHAPSDAKGRSKLQAPSHELRR